MRRIALAMLLTAVSLALAPITRAQEPQRSQDEETPTFSTEDVRPTEPVLIPTVGDVANVDDLFNRIYRDLERSGASSADVAALRARVDRGEEIRVAMRFDVGPDGRITNFAREAGTGLESVDRLMTKDATGAPLGADAANYRNVHVEFNVTKLRLRVNASATAPTVEKAAEVEQFVQMMRSNMAGSGGRSMLDGLTLSRQGADLSLALTLAIADVVGAR